MILGEAFRALGSGHSRHATNWILDDWMGPLKLSGSNNTRTKLM